MNLDLSWGEQKTMDLGDERVQGSAAWLKWRGKGIGSSDAAVLLGWSPWKNIKQLYEEKLGLWKPTFGAAQQSAMDRGKELEPKIRQWYEHAVDALFPDDTATDDQLECLRASFDGINRKIVNEDKSVGRIIEIKAPNAKDHALAKAGEVPEKYIPQVQWLMMVGKMPWCDYVSYGTDTTYAVVHVKADPVIQAELRSRAELFWSHVQTKTPVADWEKFVPHYQTSLDLGPTNPAPLIVSKETYDYLLEKVDSPQIADQEVEGLVATAILIKDHIENLEGQFEALKIKLKKILGDEEKMTRGEAIFGWQTRKGNVDYSVIPELIGVDLEQFRKPPVKAFYFKRKNEK